MAELSVAQRAVLAQMLERVPDRVLKTLSGAVAQMPGERAAALSIMIGDETIDRRRRAIAFGPLLPMFRPRPDGVESTHFPAGVLPRLWKAASSKEPELLLVLDDYRPIEENPKMRQVADRICVAAAAATSPRSSGRPRVTIPKCVRRVWTNWPCVSIWRPWPGAAC